MIEQHADAAKDALEGAGAADRIVLRRRKAIHRHTEFEAVERCVLSGSETLEPFVLEDGPVGQHRRGAVSEREFEDRRHVAMEERLAAGEVILLDAERDRFVEMALDGRQIEKAEVVVVRTATDEAMRAGEIA